MSDEDKPDHTSVRDHPELPECPFCHRKEIRSFKDQYGYRVICYEGDFERDNDETGCGIMTSPHISRESAIETWSNRTPR